MESFFAECADLYSLSHKYSLNFVKTANAERYAEKLEKSKTVVKIIEQAGLLLCGWSRSQGVYKRKIERGQRRQWNINMNTNNAETTFMGEDID